MDLPKSVCDQGLSGFWNRILVASVTARAGLSDACAISYIQYIGVVSAGLPSTAIGGAPPNSPIGISPSFPFASQYSAKSTIKRQWIDRHCRAAAQVTRYKTPGFNGLFAGLDQRSVLPRVAQKHQKHRKRYRNQGDIDCERLHHQIGAKYMLC